MQRREFLRQSVAFGAAAPLLKTIFVPGEVEGSLGTRASRAMVVRAIKPPPQGKINVAFVLTENANVMDFAGPWERSEEHTSELQSLAYLVCRLLLEKKKKENCVAVTLPPCAVNH